VSAKSFCDLTCVTMRRADDNDSLDEAPVFEVLEPRILYSADALGAGLLALPDDHTSPIEDYVSELAPALSIDLQSTTASPQSIVFIDSRVPDIDLLKQQWSQPGVQIVVIDHDENAFDVIEHDLSEADSRYESITIFSHGSAGKLFLGNETIDQAALDDNAMRLANWSAALTEEADIYLFGCDVAANDTGLAFIQTLADLTGADVAASNDSTGHASQRGDWDLEVSIGATKTDSSLANRMAEWTYSLAVIEVNYERDDIAFDTTITIDDLANLSQVSLRAAITAANNTAGDDIILLTSATGHYVLANDESGKEFCT